MRRTPGLGAVGALLLALLVLAAILAGPLAPHDPRALAGEPFQPPGPGHPLGTDDVGRDLLSQLLHGARVSLFFGFAAATIAIAIGTAVALVAGYRRGAVDTVLMRIVDVVLVLPFLPLLLVISVFLESGIATQITAVAALMWAGPARELRSQVLSLRERGHVQAALSMGAGPLHVLRSHLLPGIVPLVIPQLVLTARSAILIEASLAFLGLGDPTVISWGTMLYHANARGVYLSDAWRWWVVPPGLAIGVTVLAFALVGIALEERFRPRLRAGWTPARMPGGAAPAAVHGEPAPALDVRGLSVAYGDRRVVDDVSLRIAPGEALALVGESGSGKTSIAMATLGLLRASASITAGSIAVAGRDLGSLPGEALRRLRGSTIALVPQNAMNALNPVYRVGRQIGDAMTAHGRRRPTRAALLDLLRQVHLDARTLDAFPHELSGGMRQRAVLAMALANDPALLIADEPTTGLDILVQHEILRLLAELRDRRGLALLVISHDLPAVLRIADRIAIMRAGRIIEHADATRVARSPQHPCTVRLLDAVPRFETDAPADDAPPRSDVILRLRAVRKSFRAPRSPEGRVTVLDGIDLDVHDQRAVGLVGSSGAGKTTLARIILGLERADAGQIHLAGGGPPHDVARIVFQDPYDALPPHFRVGDAVAEPLRIRGTGRAEAEQHARRALETVALPASSAFLRRHPHELSGGERQRVALARALITDPRIVIADEPTSLLDAPVRAELTELLRRIRAERRTAFLYITHDIALALQFCDTIAVLDGGRIVEHAPAATIATRPAHPRTAALVAAARSAVAQLPAVRGGD